MAMASITRSGSLLRVLGLMLVLTLLPAVHAATAVNSCTVISSPGYYVLNTSIINSTAKVCINISSSNVVFDGAGRVIDGVDNSSYTYGIYVPVISGVAFTNITVKNVTLTDWYGGIYFTAGKGAVAGVTASSNIYSGIQVDGQDNTITGSNASFNSYGIITGSRNNLSDNLIEGNNHGIYISGRNNTIINNRILNSKINGIYIYRSTASGNIISGNVIENSGSYGIYFVLAPADNLIYNNKFNNTANIHFYQTVSTNKWNTSLRAGGNIVGGPFIGGNYWGSPSGTGHSDSCTDADHDGICDSTYTINSTNIDYLPLSTPPPVNNISTCAALSSPGYYVLNTSIINSTTTACINITSSNVVFDGAGMVIDGVDTLGTSGVYVNNATTTLVNVKVINLRLTDWGNSGIRFNQVNSSLVENTTIVSSTTGIYIQNSKVNSIRGNNASQNTGTGIFLVSSDANTVENNFASGNSQDGIAIGGLNNVVRYNTLRDNLDDGIDLTDAIGSVVKGNTIINSANIGIYLLRSSSTQALMNRISSGTDGIFVERSNSVEVAGNQITLASRYAIISLRSNSTSIENNTVNRSYDGIVIDASSYARIFNNTLSENEFGIWSVNSNLSSVLNNTITGSNSTGVYLQNVNDTTVDDNIIKDTINVSGILLETSRGNQIRYNTLVNNTLAGVHLNMSSVSNTLSGNNLTSNTYGVILESSNSNLLSGNVISTSLNQGIYLQSSNLTNISHNTLSGNLWGILMDRSRDNLISGNTISSSRKYGVEIVRSTNVTLSGNTVSGSYRHGIVLDASNQNQIYTNRIAGNNYSGVYIYSSLLNSVKGNNATANNRSGIHLENSNFSTIEDNHAGSNGDYGVLLHRSENNIIINVTASSNSKMGIYLNYSGGNNISDSRISSSYIGAYFLSSSNNRLVRSTIEANPGGGIRISSSSKSNTLQNVTVKHSGSGVLIDSSDSNVLNRVALIQNSIDFRASFAPNTRVAETSIGGVKLNLSFTGDIIINATSSPALEPAGYRSLGKYLNITNTSSAWVYINFSYTPSDISSAGVNESTLRIWRYNGTGWEPVPGTNAVNTAGRYVHSNLTRFSVFAPMGVDISPPVITGVKVSSVTQSSAVVSWQTDEPAGSLVLYGTSSGKYSWSVGNTTPKTAHTLKLTGLSSGTRYYFVVNSTDRAGHSNQSAEFSFTTASPPPSAGGGGGGGAPKNTVEIPRIKAGESYVAVFNRKYVPHISSIEVFAARDQHYAKVRVSTYSKKPDWVIFDPAPGRLYSYLLIKYSKPGTYVKKASITFLVKEAWLRDNDIDPSTVAMYRLNENKKWEKLTTRPEKVENGTFYYTAETPGFSWFAITGRENSGFRDIFAQVEEVASPPPSAAPAPEEKPPAPVSPQEQPETSPPVKKVPEPEKKPEPAPEEPQPSEPAEKKGICGPTFVALIAVLPLLLLGRRPEQ